MDKYIFEIIKMNTDSLDNISLKILPGAVYAIIGLAGLEQEEFIKGLAGLIKVTGNIKCSNRLFNFDLSILRDNKIDFVFKSPSLFDKLTVAENLFVNNLNTKNFKPFIDWGQVKNESKSVLKQLDINIDYKKRICDLKSEEKKLISICIAFFNNPDVIIMHEPTNNLTAVSIQKLNNLIINFKRNGGSVIYVTRHWEEALKIADRLSILLNGKLVGNFNSKEAKKDPKKLMNTIMGSEIDTTYKDFEHESNKFLDVVFKATEFMTSKYELKDVLQLFAEYAVDIMKADGCTLNIIDEFTKTIIDTVSLTRSNEICAQLKKDIIFDICKNVNIYYASLRQKDFFLLFEEIENVKTIICIPVFIRSHVTGFIQMNYKNLYVYTEKESKYLSTLARQAAIAIEDTRLMGRSALLQESHHRIKNNLQYVISLITLQKAFIKNNNTKSIEDIFDNIILRIKSIASVHDLISKDEFGRSIINVKELIQVIINFLKQDKINFIHDLDDIFISYENASAIALIINELVSNAIEHAFYDQDKCIVEIICIRDRKGIILQVIDNGIGLPENFDLYKQNSLGLSIVQSIVRNQLSGQITIKSNNGTQAFMTLPM